MGDKEKVQNASLCIDNAHGQSIWNVHLEPWSSEAHFHSLYETKYAVLFAKARNFLSAQTARINSMPKGGAPKAAVFISAGFDASQWEGAGMQRHAVNVPTSFYERFTKDAVKLAEDTVTGAEGRVISVLEGGYSNRALTSGVLSHVVGLCHGGSANNAVGIRPELDTATPPADHDHMQPCDAQWWQPEALDVLESYDEIDPAVPKKVRNGGLVPTFASPTESFSSKVVDPAKFQRSMSATMRMMPPVVDDKTPEVDWIAASHALCKVLLPVDRTITSCKSEELAGVRAKKSRQSVGAQTVPLDATAEGRQLRDRKIRQSDGIGASPDASALPKTSRGGRRKTLDGVGPSLTNGTPVKPRPTSRRSSSGSAADLQQSTESAMPAVPTIPAQFAGPKTPVVATPRKTSAAKKQRSPVKAKAVPRAEIQQPRNIPATTTPLTTTSTESQAIDSGVNSSTNARATLNNGAGSTTADMDSLTSAVKRITLKLGTKEESERKVREMQAAAASGAKTVPPPAAYAVDADAAPMGQRGIGNGRQQTARDSSAQRDGKTTPRRTSPRRPSPRRHEYQAESSYSSPAVSSQQKAPVSFGWRPANAYTSIQARPAQSVTAGKLQSSHRAGSHGFTSTSPIPFQTAFDNSDRNGKASEGTPGRGAWSSDQRGPPIVSEGESMDIWEVPDTPAPTRVDGDERSGR